MRRRRRLFYGVPILVFLILFTAAVAATMNAPPFFDGDPTPTLTARPPPPFTGEWEPSAAVGKVMTGSRWGAVWPHL